MHIKSVVGNGTTDDYEQLYTTAVNLTGAASVPGEAVCFSHTASDGRSFVDPAISNFLMFAGIVQDTLGTGSYGVLRRYGLASVLVSGAADAVAGAHAILVTGTPVTAIGTAAQWAGTALTAQVPRITLLKAVTAGEGLIKAHAFVQF